ncbi:hypothetical protein J2TS6_46660 [Paenibacillus albilobatus]|uniref:Uncharacterized protein n=1 Tax=Paenibacillus albilobatus TaxID=2716884 RepID=A0A919XMI8_9BACL|nr:hypothetical protein [Paenibacillus albilobatus]GIO33525.1 hypothetical protein J2TS6_46660 [Paenibacillus albilobatus]
MSLKNTIQFIEANKRVYLQRMKSLEQQTNKIPSQQQQVYKKNVLQAAKLK